jgi:hypothetical protein
MSDTDDSETSSASTIKEASPEQVALSEELKGKANALFQENHFQDAIDLYTQAIDLTPKNHVSLLCIHRILAGSGDP